jgi:hypothetical protein
MKMREGTKETTPLSNPIELVFRTAVMTCLPAAKRKAGGQANTFPIFH